MAKAIKKKTLVNEIAKETELSKRTVNRVVDMLIRLIEQNVSEGNKVQLTGFGTFEPRQHRERKGRNPRTGEEITIPATRVAIFRTGKIFKRHVRQ